MADELSGADKLAIHELLARYTHALDYGDIESMGNIWCQDAHFLADQPAVDVRGLNALQQFFRDTVAAVPHVRHVISNVFVDGRGDVATLQAYVQIIDFRDKTLVAAGRYRDQVVRTALGWRIQKRQFTAN